MKLPKRNLHQNKKPTDFNSVPIILGNLISMQAFYSNGLLKFSKKY
ncbi:hypothetical protein HY025_02065 [Candidatus Daviesbacteria bacterium]|nr:hypothetical protein [Candidatus Daviesbacteria bacterium]